VKQVGDDKAGFSSVFDADVGAVRVRAWGFWDAKISEAFAAAIADVCRASPRGSALWMDMTDLKPLREEGQRSFGTLMRSTKELGIVRTVIATTSHLTKLQLLRLVAEHGNKESVQFAAIAEDRARLR
jgi:hypothetical protein